MFAALKSRDYRLLFFGQGVSHLGDQFHLVALPWLVLTLTRDPLQLGLVLAAAGIPRAAFMLFGGAWADRHSPRTIMLVSDVLRFAVSAALAAAILSGAAQMWMVYVLAISFGLVSGFFMPAAEATIPRLLEDSQLESGNSLLMGATQLSNFLGPAAAGLLIAAFGAGAQAAGQIGQAASVTGIGVAFALDALSFLASAGALALMSHMPALNPNAETHPVTDVLVGLRYAWSSARIRWMVVLIAIANFLVAGPMFVGIPVLAHSRLAGGAAALGAVFSAYGLGSLAGMIVAASAPRPSDRVFAWGVVGLMVGFAISMSSLAFVSATWIVVALMLVTGVGNGYTAIVVMTSLQRMSDEALTGRVMSLVMLAMFGLVPLSQALSGAVIRASSTALFVGAGGGFVFLALLAMLKREMWTMHGERISADGIVAELDEAADAA